MNPDWSHACENHSQKVKAIQCKICHEDRGDRLLPWSSDDITMLYDFRSPRIWRLPIARSSLCRLVNGANCCNVKSCSCPSRSISNALRGICCRTCRHVKKSCDYRSRQNDRLLPNPQSVTVNCRNDSQQVIILCESLLMGRRATARHHDMLVTRVVPHDQFAELLLDLHELLSHAYAWTCDGTWSGKNLVCL